MIQDDTNRGFQDLFTTGFRHVPLVTGSKEEYWINVSIAKKVEFYIIQRGSFSTEETMTQHQIAEMVPDADIIIYIRCEEHGK